MHCAHTPPLPLAQEEGLTVATECDSVAHSVTAETQKEVIEQVVVTQRYRRLTTNLEGRLELAMGAARAGDLTELKAAIAESAEVTPEQLALLTAKGTAEAQALAAANGDADSAAYQKASKKILRIYRKGLRARIKAEDREDKEPTEKAQALAALDPECGAGHLRCSDILDLVAYVYSQRANGHTDTPRGPIRVQGAHKGA